MINSPTHSYFTCKAIGECGFLDLTANTKFLLSDLCSHANSENVHPRKFPAIIIYGI